MFESEAHSGPLAARSHRRRALQAVLIVAMTVLSLAMWIGVPLGWIWIAGRFVYDYGSIYLVVLFAIPATMIAVGWLIHRVNRLYLRVSEGDPEGERGSPLARPVDRVGAPHHVVEMIMVGSVCVALVAFVVWFFFLAGSPLAPMG